MKLHKQTIAQLEAMVSALASYRKIEQEREKHRQAALPPEATAEDKAAYTALKGQLATEGQRARETFLKAALPCEATVRQIIKTARAGQAPAKPVGTPKTSP